jgi:hypothetical protein
MAPEFFAAKFVVCITFHDKPGERQAQVTSFKIWPQKG